jgi:WhiB family redox-sensing transcriptional regulator
MSTRDWRQQAACIGIDPRAFFSTGHHARAQVDAARAICLTCPVRQQCAAFAIEVGETNGVWGGMSQKQLRQRRRRTRTSTRTAA